MIKKICAVLLLIIFTANLALATALPLAGVAIGTMAVGTASVLGYVSGQQIKSTAYTAMSIVPSGVKKVYDARFLIMPMYHYWVDNHLNIMRGQLNGRVSNSKLIADQAASPTTFASKYPKLNTAINNAVTAANTPPADPTTYAAATVGSSVFHSTTGTYRTVTNKSSSVINGGYCACGIGSSSDHIQTCSNPITGYYAWGSWVTLPAGTNACNTNTTLTLGSTISSPPSTATPEKISEEFSKQLAGSAVALAPANVYSDFYGEIDDYIKSNPNVLTFHDDDGNEVALPQSDTNSINNALATAGFANAVQKAQDIATSARSAANAAAAALANDPTNTDLQKKASETAAAASAAELDLAKVQAQAAQNTSEQANTNITAPSIANPSNPAAYGDATSIDFGVRFQTFLARMQATSLFSLPGILIGSVPNGTYQSVMTINCARFGTHVYDFSDLSSIFSILKIIMLIITGFYCTRILLRGGGG